MFWLFNNGFYENISFFFIHKNHTIYNYSKTLNVALISDWHIGHDVKEWAHVTQVIKCPHGIKTMDRLYLEHDKQTVDEDDDWTGFLSMLSGNIIFRC